MSGLQVKPGSNRDVALQEDTIRNFKESLRGELLRSEDTAYDDDAGKLSGLNVWVVLTHPNIRP